MGTGFVERRKRWDMMFDRRKRFPPVFCSITAKPFRRFIRLGKFCKICNFCDHIFCKFCNFCEFNAETVSAFSVFDKNENMKHVSYFLLSRRMKQRSALRHFMVMSNFASSAISDIAIFTILVIFANLTRKRFPCFVFFDMNEMAKRASAFYGDVGFCKICNF